MMPSTAATASAVSTVETNMSRRTFAMTRAAPGADGATASADAGSTRGAEALSGAASGGDTLAPSHAAKSGGTAFAASLRAGSGGEPTGFASGGTGGLASGANGSSIGEDRISFSLVAASSGVLPSAAAG